MDFDELYDEDEEIIKSQQEESTSNNFTDVTNSSNNNDDSIIDYLLKTKGIDDSSKIIFEDDNGQISERDWNSLNAEEKINILNTQIPQQDDLSNEEIDFINQLRQQNLTPSQFIQQLQSQSQTIVEPQYQVDDLSDDEIFILDLESRVGELTDEQAAQALANSKQDEDLFKKQVAGIRKEYKDREDFIAQQQQSEIEEEQQNAYNQFQESIIDSISNFNSIGNLDLNFEDSDRNELADFMLSRDETGNNYLWQALQDPDTLTKAAWFILNGEDAINNISDYFINQIKLVSENQYKKGFEEGKNGTTPSRPNVVFNTKTSNSHHIYKTADELFDDED